MMIRRSLLVDIQSVWMLTGVQLPRNTFPFLFSHFLQVTWRQ